jgi:hypothetical protein
VTKSIIETCWDTHRQTGTLGYPREYEPGKPHCSMAVCDDPKCRASANRAVRKVTGHDGVYLSYQRARQERRAAEMAEFYYPNDPGPQQLRLEMETASHG